MKRQLVVAAVLLLGGISVAEATDTARAKVECSLKCSKDSSASVKVTGPGFGGGGTTLSCSDGSSSSFNASITPVCDSKDVEFSATLDSCTNPSGSFKSPFKRTSNCPESGKSAAVLQCKVQQRGTPEDCT